MSEDAHEIAQRIVREVLDAHAAEAALDASAQADDDATPPDHGIDLRETHAAVAADAAADALDDSEARQTARRIVAEVLESHALAERDAEHLPTVAEGESAGPASATPVLHPITGRPAVLPSLPDEPDLGEDADVADDAAAIARRIVASVLNQRPRVDDGPPPVPEHVRVPVDPAPVVADPIPVAAEPEPAAPEPVEPEAAEPAPVEPEPVEPEPEAVEPEAVEPAAADPAEPEPEPASVEPGPDVTAPIDPVLVHGSHRLVRPDPAAEAEPGPVLAEEPPVDDDAPVTPDPEPTPETTAVLSPDEPAEADATQRVPVATLERPVARDVAAEPTMSLPSADPPRRTGRWLIASILGAVALAVLLPLAVEALRTLVSLS